MATDEDVKKDFDQFYTYGINNWGDFIPEADTDTMFYLGKQWQDDEVQDLLDEGRNAYVFNYIQRNVHLVGGHQVKNRKGIGCKGVGQKDNETSAILNGVMTNVNSQGVYDVISECFEDQLICGLSMATLYMDYTDDIVNGEIKITSEPFQNFIIDPKFTKIDLSDCGYILKRKFVNKEELKLLQPDLNVKDLSSGIPDQKFGYQSISANYAGQPMYAYDEMWLRNSKVIDGWVDLKTGQAGIWGGAKEEFKLFLALNPTKVELRRAVPSVKYHAMVNRQVVYQGDELSGIDDYPHVPFIGVYKPQVSDYAYKLYGMVRPARDPQKNYNKIRSKQDDIIKSSLYSSWLVEEGAMKNIDDAYKAGQGQVLIRKKGSSPESVVRLPHQEVPQSIVQLSDQLNTDMTQIPGLSEEALGVSDPGNQEITATVAKMRNANSLTVLQKFFTNLTQSEIQIGKKELRMIQVNYTDEKIAEITEREITPQISAAIRQRNLNRNILVAEQDLTDTQRNLTYMQAVHAKQIIGEEFPSEIIVERLPITEKDKVMEAFQRKQQAVQEQQAKIAEQEELGKRLVNSEIVHKLSLSEQQRETAVSRQALAMQHMANSYADRAKALLDNVKAVKEIQGMEQEKLIGGISFLLQLQDKARSEDLAVVKQTSNQTERDMVATNQMNQGQSGNPQKTQAKLLSLIPDEVLAA